MATIEEILEMSHEQIGALNEDQLQEALKEVIALEPKPLPSIGVAGVETSFTLADALEDENPIKLRKPRSSSASALKRKQTAAEILLEAKKLLAEMK